MATSNQSGSTGTRANPLSSSKENAKKSGVSSKSPRTTDLPESRDAAVTRSRTSVIGVDQDYVNFAYEDSGCDSQSSSISSQFSDRNRDRNGKGSGIKLPLLRGKKDDCKSVKQWKPKESVEAECCGTSSHNNKGKEWENHSKEEEKERRNVQVINAPDFGYGSIAGSEQGDDISEKSVTQDETQSRWIPLNSIPKCSGRESEVKSKEKMGGDHKTAPHIQSVRTKHSNHSSQGKGDKNSSAAQVLKKSIEPQTASSLSKADGLRLKALIQDRAKKRRMLPHANTENPEEVTLEIKESIGKSGGEISLGGCKVNFYRETLAQDTSVVTKVHPNPGIHCLPLDPEYFSVTPVLNCHVSGEMHGQAEIKMKSCCFVEKGSERMEAHVLHLQTGSSKWQKFQKVRITEKSEFCFTVNAFSFYVVVLPVQILKLVKFKLRSHIDCTKENISMNGYFKNTTMEKYLVHQPDVFQNKFRMKFDTLVVKFGDEIKMQLKCSSDEYDFPEPFVMQFAIDSDFLRVKGKSSKSCLDKDTTNTNESIRFQFEVCKVKCGSQKRTKAKHHFKYCPADYQQQDCRKIKLTQEFEGLTHVGTLHAGAINCHYNRAYDQSGEGRYKGTPTMDSMGLIPDSPDEAELGCFGCCGKRKKKKSSGKTDRRSHRTRSTPSSDRVIEEDPTAESSHRTEQTGLQRCNTQNQYEEISDRVEEECENRTRESGEAEPCLRDRKKKWYKPCTIL